MWDREDARGSSNSLTCDHLSSPRTKALATWWLSQCKANEGGKHDDCKPSRPDYLPTRLLDVGKALDLGMLQLVNPEIQPQQFARNRDYVTLSHCWGDLGSKYNPLLLEDNFAERQRNGIHIRMLPKTFQDAIQIAGCQKGTSVVSREMIMLIMISSEMALDRLPVY